MSYKKYSYMFKKRKNNCLLCNFLLLLPPRFSTKAADNAGDWLRTKTTGDALSAGLKS